MIKFYKLLTIAGILLWLSLCVVTFMQAENPDRFDLKLGWISQFIEILVYLSLFMFFILCFRAYSQIQEGYFSTKTYYPIIIFGLVNLIIPTFLFFLWLKDVFDPPKPTLLDPIFQTIFPKNNYTEQLIKTSNCLILITGLISAVLILFSIRLKLRVSKNYS